MRVPFEIFAKLSPLLQTSLWKAAVSVTEREGGRKITPALFLKTVQMQDPAVFDRYFGQEDDVGEANIDTAVDSTHSHLGEATINIHPALVEIIRAAYIISAAIREERIELRHIAVALGLDSHTADKLFKTSRIYVRGARESRPLANTVWECLFINNHAKQIHRRTFRVRATDCHGYKLSVRNGDIFGNHRVDALVVSVNGLTILNKQEIQKETSFPDYNVSLHPVNHLTAEMAGEEYASISIRFWH
jgi:hypothetical protein